jgi:hypothetical protein
MVIDAPAAGGIVRPDFSISGWAFQQEAPGTGVDAIHVWAYPVGSGSPLFLGAATLGDVRPDVGTLFGPRYAPSGYHLDVTGMADGRYDIVVFARNSATGIFNMRRLVRVRVLRPGFEVRLAIDAPQPGAVHRTSGWRAMRSMRAPSALERRRCDPRVGAARGRTSVLPRRRDLGRSAARRGASTGLAAAAQSGYHLDVAGVPATTS